MRADDDAHASRGARQLLDGDRVGQRVEPRAAHVLRIWHSEQSKLGGPSDQVVGELALAFHLVGHRHDLALGEAANRATNLFVLRGEGEVHRRPESSSPPR